MPTSCLRARMVTSRPTRTALRMAALLAFSASASAAIPFSERQVLLDLYSQTDGANWTNNTGWNGAAGSECTWYGVTCDAGELHVTEIALGANNLVGTLPSNLNDLTALRSFGAQGNDLTGSIPALDGLSELWLFSVSENALSGSIPPLNGLPNLVHFSAHSNQLTGGLPDLSANPQLNYFAVAQNQLTGNLPDLVGHPALVSFNASVNQLSGPIPSLSGLTALREFTVDNNQLSGSIPSLSDLTLLTTLGLSVNQLSGTIPSFAGLNDLQIVYLAGNQLTGDVPLVPSPSALLPSASSLCPNSLNPSIGSANDLAWDVATGLTPWSQGCTAAPITLSISDASLIEGNSGSTLMHFTVSPSSAPAAAVTVDWYTSSGTATPGPDYNGGTGSLSWSVGDASSQTIDIEILGDTDIEADEDFSAILQNAVGATLADASGTGTIINDDNTALPLLTISDVSTVEGDAGTTGFAFTIALSAAPSAPVSVTWATADGSATAASGDYASGTATASWNAGDSAPRTITVFVNGDTDIELDETFSVQLSNANGATIADGTGTGTIQDDDTPIGVAPQITSPTPPNATVGVPYHFVVTATGTPVPSFADIGLPAGLTIDAVSGLISGTPTAPGTSHVFIIADNGVRPDALQEFDMTVSGQPTANVHRVPMLSPFNLLLLMLVLPLMAMRGMWRR